MKTVEVYDILTNVVKRVCVHAKEVRHMQNCQQMRSRHCSISVFCSKPINFALLSVQTQQRSRVHTHFWSSHSFFSVEGCVLSSAVLCVCAGELSGCADGVWWFHFPFIKNSCQQMSNLQYFVADIITPLCYGGLNLIKAISEMLWRMQ